MSKKKVIILVLLFLLAILALFFYIYFKNQYTSKYNDELYGQKISNELQNFNPGSNSGKTDQDVAKELDSFKTPANTPAPGSASGDQTPPAETNPKTEAEVSQELSAFKAPPKDSPESGSEASNDLN